MVENDEDPCSPTEPDIEHTEYVTAQLKNAG
jgi:hypothetical protein